MTNAFDDKTNLTMKYLLGLILGGALLAMPACQPKESDITPLQRKQAAVFGSEAEFAVTLKEFPRAEELYAKAAKLCPDNVDYWVNLGVCRRKLNDRSGAKSAYESALTACKQEQRLKSKDAEPMVRQVYVLGLLGRGDDARAVAEKARKTFPDDPRVRSFTPQAIDQLLADANFKALAL